MEDLGGDLMVFRGKGGDPSPPTEYRQRPEEDLIANELPMRGYDMYITEPGKSGRFYREINNIF